MRRWTSLLSRSIFPQILFSLFFIVPDILIVTAVIDSRVFGPVIDLNWWHLFNVVWDVVVVKNLSFDISSYVMLCGNRSCFCFGLFLFIVVVLRAPTSGWNLVCLSSLSCNIGNTVLMFFDDVEKLLDLSLIVPAISMVQLPLRLQIIFLLVIFMEYVELFLDSSSLSLLTSW